MTGLLAILISRYGMKQSKYARFVAARPIAAHQPCTMTLLISAKITISTYFSYESRCTSRSHGPRRFDCVAISFHTSSLDNFAKLFGSFGNKIRFLGLRFKQLLHEPRKHMPGPYRFYDQTVFCSMLHHCSQCYACRV